MQNNSSSSVKPKFPNFIIASGLIMALLVFQGIYQSFKQRSPHLSPHVSRPLPPLVMEGGDPYIRALMRTISASESNVSRPYHVLYGGQYINQLDTHPEKCVPIVVGPNVGNCTTAAGRYQMLNFTWYDMAKRYHPKPSGFFRWRSYSFEPQYQDKVVYRWLKDSQVWGMDISQQLQQGNINKVLKHLSGTWTSLGYGIETNSMSRHLPNIYQKMLQEELNNQGT
ncbi:MAG: glycoside hydrolase family protein [Microcystaceae cyanobacterium]